MTSHLSYVAAAYAVTFVSIGAYIACIACMTRRCRRKARRYINLKNKK